MTKIPTTTPKTLTRAGFSALGLGLALALSACGHSKTSSDAASADNVEIPAEEAMSGLPVGAAPVADTAEVADSAVSGR
jgi:hypothetical protein